MRKENPERSGQAAGDCGSEIGMRVGLSWAGIGRGGAEGEAMRFFETKTKTER